MSNRKTTTITLGNKFRTIDIGEDDVTMGEAMTLAQRVDEYFTVASTCLDDIGILLRRSRKNDTSKQSMEQLLVIRDLVDEALIRTDNLLQAIKEEGQS